MQRKDSTLNIDFSDNPFDAHQFSLSYCNTPELKIFWPKDIPSEINRIFAFKKACALSPTPFPSPPPPGHSILLEVLHQDDLTALGNLPKEMCSFLSNIAVIKISPFLKDLSESDQKEISTNLQQLSLRCPQLKLIQLPDGFNATHFANLRPPIIFHKNYMRELLGVTSLDELSAQATPQDTSHPNPGILYESTPLQSTSIVSSDNQGQARYDMIPIGEALNTTKKINVRGAVIAYKLELNTITGQAELHRFEPTAITRPLTYQIKYLTLENITLYKEAPSKDEYFKINQRIPADGQFHRLRSIHPAETLEGIVGNGTESLEFHQGSDDFFYVKNHMPNEINLQFILKLSSEHNKSRLEDLGDKSNGSIACRIITTYRNQPLFQETADSTRLIPKITDSLEDWTKILYTEAAGVCWHRALAVSSIISGAISPDHVRIVRVNQNHEMIEVKNDDNEWIPLDMLGGSKAEEHYEATPKMTIPRSISPETWAADEVPNEPITAAHANMRAMLLKQCEIHKISTQEEYTSKISVHKNILLLSKTAKQDALSILRTQADLGIHTFYIQKSNDIDIGKRALILADTGPNIEPDGGDFSNFLKKATTHPTQRFSILIQWDALTPKERLTLQEMLDDTPRIKGIPVAKNIQIIGLCQNRPEDESFQSRYKGEVYTLSLPLPQAPTDWKREETISSVIDLEGESNWLEKFFGRVILVENKMTFEPGPLFDGIGANQRITLLNAANDQQEAIQYACDIARAQGYFLYHGRIIPIAPTAQFDLSNRNLNFADFEVKQVFRNAPKRAVPEAIVVNTHCVDILFQDKCIVEGIYSERPGLLERFRGQHLVLHVNRHSEASDLTESQWYTLFNRAKMYGISLSLYLEPGVSLPRNVTIEKDLPADSADKDSISVKETSPSSPLVFNVEDECFSSLFYSVRFTSEGAGFSDFAIELGGALSALLAGETVILKGIFSPELLDQLAPLSLSNHSFIIINGERVDFSGTLILQAETARSMPQSPSIIYSESDCSHEDVGTEADSKTFISRRKAALLGVLDQHHIARISGPTGVGKTSLIDEIAKLEQATLYQELDEFEAWALDTSEKIKILRIDEHNIENLHFTFLAPMLSERTPCVLYKGKTYELSETHKVVFAGNDLSYGGGRVSQKLFEDHSIPTLAFQDFPPCYIDHQILKPIFNKMSKTGFDICEAGLLEHDIHTEKTRLLALYYDKNQANPGSMTVRALQNQALQWCTARLLEFREASTTTDRPSSFIKAPYTTAAMSCLMNALICKDLQREGLLPGQGLGLNGVIIEGMPGLGKSALVQHCLKSHQHIRIPANLLLEDSLHETLKIIATAFDEGKPVWIDEFDACSGEGIEKAINSFLTGRHLNGQPAKKEGFLLIVTLNGAALSGRDILSPAFKARCEHVVINPLTASDIQEILEYKYPTDSPEIRAIMTNQFLSLQTSHGLTLRGLLHVLDQAHQGAPAVGGAGGGPISLFSQAPMASNDHTDPRVH